MAIIVHCPYCHQPLQEMQQACAHCNCELPAGVVYALAAAFGKPSLSPPLPSMGGPPVHLRQAPPAVSVAGPEAHPPPHNSPLRPWLAAALSLVCGLGQLYNGQVVKGMLLMILGTTAVVSLSLFIGKVLALMVWGYAIIDAFLVARRTPELPSSRKL
jgi:TM2 domain-containing membrane protein YozV